MGHHLIGGQFTVPLDQITGLLIENDLFLEPNSQVVALWQLVRHLCNLGIGHGYVMLRIASRSLRLLATPQGSSKYLFAQSAFVWVGILKPVVLAIGNDPQEHPDQQVAIAVSFYQGLGFGFTE